MNITSTLYQSRLYLSYALAAAALELFPGTQIIQGKVDEIGFSYRFQFLPHIHKSFNQDCLLRLEDTMRLILNRGFICKKIQMMRENAQELFKSKGQYRKAEQAVDYPFNIIPIVQCGAFFDTCLENAHSIENEIPFKLLSYDVQQDGIQVVGLAFEDRKELRQFCKKYSEFLKSDFQKLGLDLNFFVKDEDNIILLPKGKKLVDLIIDYWKKIREEQGFLLLENLSDLSSLEAFKIVFEKISRRSLPLRLAELGWHFDENPKDDSRFFQLASYRKDQAISFCPKELLQEELISSLQFMQKTIKIFGFEYCLKISHKQGVQEEEALYYYNELPTEIPKTKAQKNSKTLRTYAQFYLYDSLGRGYEGPFVQAIEEGPGKEVREVEAGRKEIGSKAISGNETKSNEARSYVSSSFFPCLENFAALLIEKFSGELPFWLAPEQVRVLPIKASHLSFAEKVRAQLLKAGMRSTKDIIFDRSLSERVYEASKEKVPYIILLGDKEEEKNRNQSQNWVQDRVPDRVPDWVPDWVTVRSLDKKEQSIELHRWIELLDFC